MADTLVSMSFNIEERGVEKEGSLERKFGKVAKRS
jgi:hypothetical protein